ncbi:MAG: hypothetical protein JO090_06710 [Rhizobacter sp.]|nr:hypothetical protein [Rhizobacter sp.]
MSRGRRPRSLLRAALATLLAVGAASLGNAAAAAPALKADRFRVSYQPPEDPTYAAMYEELQAAQVLESFRSVLSFVRLPRIVRLVLVDCDGDANAYYDPDELTVSVCYEYVRELRKLAENPGRPAGISAETAVRSKLLEIFLHESAHALFDQLRVPIIGRQEEAADVIASVVILHMRSRSARDTVQAVTWMYAQEAKEERVGRKKLADVHLLAEQRYYNWLCLAYGARPSLFADVVRDDVLTVERAETCQDEYRRAAYAVTRLMGPYLDIGLRDKVFAHTFVPGSDVTAVAARRGAESGPPAAPSSGRSPAARNR